MDRRVVYIDPHPKKHTPAVLGVVPGFFATIRGALSDLPRYDPINDELVAIEQLNQETRSERAAIEAVRPDVSERVERIVGAALGEDVTAEQVRGWRLDAGRLLLQDSRLTYAHYVRLMIGEALAYLSRVIAKRCDYAPDSPQARWVAAVLDTWALRQGVARRDYAIPPDLTSEADVPFPMRLLLDLNLDYRYRRLYFVIHTINRFYRRLADPEFRDATSETLDAFKRRIYGCLEALETGEEAEFLSPSCAAAVRGLFRSPHADAVPIASAAEAFVTEHEPALTTLIEQIGREGNFVRFNEDADQALSSAEFHALGAVCRRGLLIAYIGFVFWDIIVLPMIGYRPRHKLGELGEILVDRISPEDARTIRTGDEARGLRGAEFANFGAFLSRTARENDYLWGRLDSVDRLFDLLASAVGHDVAEELDLRAYKKRALAAVLDEERGRLENVRELVDRLSEVVARL